MQGRLNLTRITNLILKDTDKVSWMKDNSCKYTKPQLAAKFNTSVKSIEYVLKVLNLRYKVRQGELLGSPSKMKWLKANSAGYTTKQMEHILLTSSSTLKRVLAQFDLTYIKKNSIVNDRREIFALRRAGYSITELAAKFNVHKNTVSYLCLAYHAYPMVVCQCCGELTPSAKAYAASQPKDDYTDEDIILL